MQIIIISDRVGAPRRLNVSIASLAMMGLGVVVFAVLLSFAVSWLSVQYRLPFVSNLVFSLEQESNRKNEEALKDNLSVMAGKLGDMQAQMMRLDALSERVSKLSGVAVPKADGRGGPWVPPKTALSHDELLAEIERFSELLSRQGEGLTELESRLMEQRINATLLPTALPIHANKIGSNFGTRLDPFNGRAAQHEGLDFPTDVGTDIFASAGGVVTTAEYHPQYGNVIDIDHGNDFSSRYAHLSRLDVKVGQVVKRNQKIAASGNTGRSTGPHLHFEVRFRGVAQNPSRFLRQTQIGSLIPQDKEAVREKKPAPEKNDKKVSITIKKRS